MAAALYLPITATIIAVLLQITFIPTAEAKGRFRRQETDDNSTTSSGSKSTHVRFTPPPKPRSKDAPFVCPFEGGLFANPDTCRSFYSCTAGEAFPQSCPPSLYFDDVKKYCTFRNEAICGPVKYETTTAAQVDESLVAKKCDPAACRLPECFCSSDGTQIPGGLNPEDIPQMVILSFSGGVNHLNYPYYETLLSANRTNPNGCRIPATFFVSHDYTNYQYVQKLHAMGNEIAVNSISHRKPEEYWTRGTYENWTMEMVGMREILTRFAGIPKEEIIGVRGPFTKCGGNEQFDMMNDFGFIYDATMATPLSRVPSWPFSMEYKIPFKCRAGNCPVYSYPGVWEMPINIMYSESGEGGNCAFLDQCVFLYSDADSILTWLMENFDRHHKINKAPLSLNLQTSWFLDKESGKAINRFVDALLERDDVHFVTYSQALQWVVQPTPLASIAAFEPWVCPEPRPPVCNLPKSCAVPHSGKDVDNDIRYMQTCFECPARYPWVGNAKGEDKEESDVYLPDPSHQDGPPHEAAPHETVPKAETLKETAPKETAPKETAPRETAPRETAPRETTPKETTPEATSAP